MSSWGVSSTGFVVVIVIVITFIIVINRYWNIQGCFLALWRLQRRTGYAIKIVYLHIATGDLPAPGAALHGVAVCGANDLTFGVASQSVYAMLITRAALQAWILFNTDGVTCFCQVNILKII